MLFDLINNGNFELMAMLYRVPGILIGLTIHECAHAWVALKCGDPTAKNLGRITLDPTKHMDPIGTLMLVLVGFGWAKPVPINNRNFKHPIRDDVFVSLAGVISNFIFAFILTGIYVLLIVAFKVTNEIAIGFFVYGIMINLSLCFFNLIPIPPLDGSHILKNVLHKFINPRFWTYYYKYGYYVLLAGLILGVFNRYLTFLISETIEIFILFYRLFI